MLRFFESRSRNAGFFRMLLIGIHELIICSTSHNFATGSRRTLEERGVFLLSKLDRKGLFRCLFYSCVLGPSLLYAAVFTIFLLPELRNSTQYFSLWHAIAAVFILVSLIVHYSVTMAGMLAFGAPSVRNTQNQTQLSIKGWDRSKKIIFCFVSQGIQQRVLKRSVEEALAIGTRFNMTFGIEVVVDSAVPSDPLFSHPAISLINVPRDFQTPLRSQFKARALYYAASARSQRSDSLVSTWIVHCDEDTIVTPEAIAGIASFLETPASSSMCGAGEIKYNVAPQGTGGVFNIIDYHRTGEDLGRYRLQFAGFGAALFGAHGSFIVVPALIEEQVQFDFGPRGSITEDIYFFLRLRDLGIPCAWVGGHVREQSPGDLRNFLRQRARWITGLINVCCDGAFSLRHRIVLFAYLVMWRTTIVAGIALLLVATINSGSLLAISLWGLDMTIMGTVILVGALRNLEEDLLANPPKTLYLMAGSFLLTPVVCLLETIAVLAGVIAPRREFFVVQKRPIRIEPLPALP